MAHAPCPPRTPAADSCLGGGDASGGSRTSLGSRRRSERSPRPRTRRRSRRLLKRPRRARSATMALARFAPTPGSAIKSSAPATLSTTRPSGSTAPATCCVSAQGEGERASAVRVNRSVCGATASSRVAWSRLASATPGAFGSSRFVARRPSHRATPTTATPSNPRTTASRMWVFGLGRDAFREFMLRQQSEPHASLGIAQGCE